MKPLKLKLKCQESRRSSGYWCQLAQKSHYRLSLRARSTAHPRTRTHTYAHTPCAPQKTSSSRFASVRSLGDSWRLSCGDPPAAWTAPSHWQSSVACQGIPQKRSQRGIWYLSRSSNLQRLLWVVWLRRGDVKMKTSPWKERSRHPATGGQDSAGGCHSAAEVREVGPSTFQNFRV